MSFQINSFHFATFILEKKKKTHRTYPVIISNPIISGSHSIASFSALDTELSVNDGDKAADAGKLTDCGIACNGADTGELTGFSVLDSACADGCSSNLVTCGPSFEVACAMLSLSGASAAFAIGKSILDLLRTPFVNELDNRTIKSKFTAFGHILYFYNVLFCFLKKFNIICKWKREEKKCIRLKLKYTWWIDVILGIKLSCTEKKR